MPPEELVQALRKPSPIGDISDHGCMKMAADTIERQAAAIKLLREALEIASLSFNLEGLYSDEKLVDEALALTKEFG